MPYANWIEWESLQDGYIISPGQNFETSETLPEGTDKIRIFRDDNYKIKGMSIFHAIKNRKITQLRNIEVYRS